MTQMGHNSGNWNTPMNIPCPECYVSPSTPFPGVATSLWLPVRLMHLRTKNKGATTPMVSIFSIIFPIWWPAIQGKNPTRFRTTHISFGEKTPMKTIRSYLEAKPGLPAASTTDFWDLAASVCSRTCPAECPIFVVDIFPRWGFLPHYIPSGYLT